MVERMFCAKCKEVSYTATHNVDAPCPYCGFDIMWKSVGRKLFKRGKAESSLPQEWSALLYLLSQSGGSFKKPNV